MEHVPAQTAAFLLTFVFGWSAAAKVLRWRTWRAIVPRYRLPSAFVAATIGGVPLVEGAVPILFIFGASRAAGALSLALLSAFSLAVLRARRLEGDRLPCGCFGKTTSRDYRMMIVRNALLATAAAVALSPGRDVALLEGLGAPNASEAIAVVLSTAGIGLIAWMVWNLRASLRGER